ncbi:MAG: glycosyltransferase family 2 protein [Chloroflexi bacterium]|nr:glycosyltransferase family 2 protein [Chloroflexota bacterium]MDA1145874.1 glycosyltransferase family 2 protein [Chloroflexota bacterium]
MNTPLRLLPDRRVPERVAVAVLVPCYNEEATIGRVVSDFRAALPDATVFVCDNASTDATADRARAAGAVVLDEPRAGKGNAVRRLFGAVEAEVYVIVDGDDTYDARVAPRAIDRLVSERLDMVNVARISEEVEAYRIGHRLGNRVLNGITSSLFGDVFDDMLSGYRVFSRRFVKSFPALSGGFETETELTIHALSLRMPVAEVAAPYKSRSEGSDSKLRTYRDGAVILRTIGLMVKEEQPLRFFSAIALVLMLTAIGLAIPVFVDYARTGLVPRFPTAILASAIVLLASLSFFAGLILDSVARGRLEARRMRYLSYESAGAHAANREQEAPPEAAAG